MTVTEFTTTTPYGEMHVTPGGVRLHATGDQLRDWARRPGEAWPCSGLARCDEVTADFDGNGLCDLTIRDTDGYGDDNITGDELSAWALTVARDTLPTAHPAWLPMVGQFDTPRR